MSYRIVVTLTARTDAVETFRWMIAEQSPDAAARWYAGFQKAIAKLSRNPERHPVAEEESELAGITLRQMLYGRRRGIYRILFVPFKRKLSPCTLSAAACGEAPSTERVRGGRSAFVVSQRP